MSLHRQFTEIAKQKRVLTNQLLALLPAIYRTKVYKKYTRTIQGYAWQFAQIPESVVNKTLKLESRLKNKKILKNAIAEVGIHKVAMVESLVTNENEEIMVDKIKNMSSAAIQAMVKEIRNNNDYVTKFFTFEASSSLQKMFSTVKKLLNISELSDSQAFEVILEYVIISKNNSEIEKNDLPNTGSSRYINAKLKNKIVKKFDNKCSYPNCDKKAQEIHHVDRFAKCKNHKNIVPLCRIHHEFAHNNLIANELDTPDKWLIQMQKTTNLIDLKYQKFRL